MVAGTFDVAPVALIVCAPSGPAFVTGIVAAQLKVPVDDTVGAHRLMAAGDASFVNHTTATFSPDKKCMPVIVTWVPFGPEVGDTASFGVRVNVVVPGTFDTAPVALIVCAPSGPAFALGIVAAQLNVPVAVDVGVHNVSVDGEASFVSQTTDTLSLGAKCDPEMVTGVPDGPVFGDTDTGGGARKKVVAASRPEVPPLATSKCAPIGPRLMLPMLPLQLKPEFEATTLLHTGIVAGAASLVR